MLILYLILLLHNVLSCTYSCAKNNTCNITEQLQNNKINILVSCLIIIVIYTSLFDK